MAVSIQKGIGYRPQKPYEEEKTGVSPVKVGAGMADLILKIGNINKDIQNT